MYVCVYVCIYVYMCMSVYYIMYMYMCMYVYNMCKICEFVISEQFPMRYCSTWLRSLLCYIKKFVIEEFVIRVFHCSIIYVHAYQYFCLSCPLFTFILHKHTHMLTVYRLFSGYFQTVCASWAVCVCSLRCDRPHLQSQR